jgi:hypothetical protein
MKTIARVLLLAMIPAFAACDDDGSGPELDVTGTYQLQTINGATLPFVLLQTGTTYRLEVLSGEITLNSNGTFTEEATVREDDNGTITTETQTVTGTYTQLNNAVSLRDTDGVTLTAAINGNTMTFIEDGVTLVYRR